MGGRRRFGKVRKLPSGKWQASFIGPDERRQNAPHTFSRKSDAEKWLVRVESDISRGAWRNEQLARVAFRDYAEAYLKENPNVDERWAETCRRNMRLHMGPLLDLPLSGITAPVVRSWYAAALRGNGGRTSIAQSYRFLRTVMNAAIRDDAIVKNPCQIPGAGNVKTEERPTAMPDEVQQLIDAITPRYRAAVVLGAWCGLRRGEICALRTDDVDLSEGIVYVRRNRVELLETPRAFDKDPKTAAGKRTVNVPPHVLPYIVEHAEQWAGDEYFFVGRDGKPMRGNTVYQAFVRARKKVGIDMTFHDLRHTGQTLAALAGASLADLKRRLGHSSSAAALRYMHAVEGRDAEVAAALSELANARNAARMPRPRTSDSRTERARSGHAADANSA